MVDHAHDPASELLLATARDLSGRVGAKLRQVRKTVTTAESCTGGLVGSLLTDVSGSSDYVLGGVIAYSNDAKRDLLGVAPALLEWYGAVSEPVAIAMAKGARERFGADFAVSVTGIAGPTGGTPEKPVGLVFVALSSHRGDTCRRFLWGRDRIGNKIESALAALALLDEAIGKET